MATDRFESQETQDDIAGFTVTKDFSGTTDAGGNLNVSSLVPGTATIIGYNSRVGFVPYKYSDTGWALRATTVDANGFQKILPNTAVSGSVTYRP